jgi:hypothetical protein
MNSRLQNLDEVGLDVWPQLLNHPVDKLHPVHVGVDDPRRQRGTGASHVDILIRSYQHGLPCVKGLFVGVRNIERQNTEIQNIERQSAEIQKVERQSAEIQNVDFKCRINP